MATDQEASNELRQAADAAGMSPERYVALSGKTSFEEWQAAREAEEAKAREGK